MALPDRPNRLSISPTKRFKMTSVLRSVLLRSAGTAALLLSGTAIVSAQTITGGGSTLASTTYVAQFGAYSHPGITYDYFPSGSSAAQSAFLTNTSSLFGGSAPTGVSVDFGASDATLTTAQIAAFLTANPGHPLIQLPTFGTPITLPFNRAGKTSNGAETLTNDQVCGVFSGQITTWNAIEGAAASPTITLAVAYRSDGSGTSFLLTQHLGATCNSTNSNFFNTGFPNAGKTSFGGTTTFASLFPNSTVPANFIAGSGSPGVEAAVNNNANTIGYLSPDFTQIAPANNGAPGFPFVAKVGATAATAVLPDTPHTKTALGTAPLPTNVSDQTQWVPAVPNPSTGYPVVGYTTWEVASCYASASTGAAVVAFLKNLYNATDTAPGPTVFAQINNRGFVPVSGSSGTAPVLAGSLAADIVNTFLSGTGSLAINTTTACSGGR
jgi:phosphate transport system substrate-binding protein